MENGQLGRIYPSGKVIFKEGDVGDVLYVLQSGNVKITKKTQESEVTIAVLKEGEIFGEMALFDKLPRCATAVAMGKARVLSIDKAKLFSTISRDPTLMFRILESMSRRIRGLDEKLAKFKKGKTRLLDLHVDVKETCSLILEEINAGIRADNGSLMLLDDDKKNLSIMAAFGTESAKKVKLAPGLGIAGDVLKTGQAEMINKVADDSRFVRGSEPICSLLCVPLKYKKDVYGVINMSYCSEKYFTIEDLKLLHSFAAYASLAIVHARNFTELQGATNEVLQHATIWDV